MYQVDFSFPFFFGSFQILFLSDVFLTESCVLYGFDLIVKQMEGPMWKCRRIRAQLVESL